MHLLELARGRRRQRRPCSPRSTPPSGRRARPRGASPASASLDELLDPNSPHRVDVVDLCTPPSMHEEQILRCLDAGVHVICEKPLVDSVAACDRLTVAAERAAATSGARFMPIFQYRFGDGAARARALIDAGITGPSVHRVVAPPGGAAARATTPTRRGAARGRASAAAASSATRSTTTTCSPGSAARSSSCGRWRPPG